MKIENSKITISNLNINFYFENFQGFNNEDDVKSESSDSESGIVVAKDGLLPPSSAAEEKLIDTSS